MSSTQTTGARPALKPVVRPIGERVSVRFPCGATAEVFPTTDQFGDKVFSYKAVKADGTEVSRTGWYQTTVESAVERAWCAVAAAPAPLCLPAAEVHALAIACDHDTKAFTKALKRILKARTGMSFSVRAGRGTGSSWVHVTGKGREMTTLERVMLSSIFGMSEVNGGEMSIRPCGHERVWILCTAAGFDMPAGIEVRPPTWD